MAQLADALRTLMDNSDDLSQLPQLISQVENLENSETDYQTRIQKLQEVNRSYLSQIPIPDQHTGKKEDEQEKQITFEEAKENLFGAMKGVE